MPWWALALVIAFGLAWVTLPDWLHLYFRWRARKLPPLRAPTLHLRYDWDAELWRPQPIPFDYDFTIWPGKEHGQPPRIIWLGEQDEPTR